MSSSRIVEFPASRRSSAGLRAPLLSWYRREHRDLPWRRTRDPYAIWLSEMLLQQTRVATALPYYHAFLERFPTIDALAGARPSAVLAAWAGLGYYRRARHFHAAARIVAREHGGKVPDDPERFRRLPGVGRYTLGAVLSIAFDRPLPVLDGNVARVLSRLAALPVSVRNPKGARTLWERASMLVPMRGAGEWNQALMELGATVCLPRAPRCGGCPVRARCRAFALGRPEDFPAEPARRATVRVRRAAVAIAARGRLLMLRREGPLLAGLWEPPAVDVAARGGSLAALRVELRRRGIDARLVATDHTLRHTITHRAIEVELWRGELRRGADEGAWKWVDPRRPAVAITALARKIAVVCGMAGGEATGVVSKRNRPMPDRPLPQSPTPRRHARPRTLAARREVAS